VKSLRRAFDERGFLAELMRKGGTKPSAKTSLMSKPLNQPELRGFGHAVLTAKSFLGDGPLWSARATHRNCCETALQRRERLASAFLAPIEVTCVLATRGFCNEFLYRGSARTTWRRG
jgi:hypothetical protein